MRKNPSNTIDSSVVELVLSCFSFAIHIINSLYTARSCIRDNNSRLRRELLDGDPHIVMVQ